MDAQLLNAVIFGIVALIGFGTSIAMQKKYVIAVGPARVITYRGIFLILILFIVLGLTWQQANFDLEYIFLGIILASISYLGLYFLNKGLETGKVGIVIPINSGRVLITAILAAVFLEERLRLGQIFSIIIIFTGIVLSSIDFNDFKNSNLFHKVSGVPYALLSAIFWGIAFAFFGIPSVVLGAFLFSLIVETTVFVLSIMQVLAQKHSIFLSKEEFKDNFLGIFLIAVLAASASIGMNLGYATGHVSIVTAISSAAPVASIVYSRIFLKEKLSLKQYIAVVLIILGIISIPLI